MRGQSDRSKSLAKMCQSDMPILVGGCHPRHVALWMVVNAVCLGVTRYQSADGSRIHSKIGSDSTNCNFSV